MIGGFLLIEEENLYITFRLLNQHCQTKWQWTKQWIKFTFYAQYIYFRPIQLDIMQ